MSHLTCGSGMRWCARADAIFDVPGMHVLDVAVDERGRLVLTVESDQLKAGCPACGVLAARHWLLRADVARRALLWAGQRSAVAEAALAVPRTAVSDRDVQRGS